MSDIDLPSFSIQEMLECGVHLGHRSSLWNPKMAPFIHSTHNQIHVIDLRATSALLKQAMQAVFATASKRGAKILFVGTKRQASEQIKQAAIRCGQHYVNHRWLGGTLTNWSTISKSIKNLDQLEETLSSSSKEDGEISYNKKELLDMSKQRAKLENLLGGIRKMSGLPDIIFVIDVNREKTAVKEAQSLKIPIVAIVDSNSKIDGIDYPIPGNDDAARAIELYCRLISESALKGIESLLVRSGIKIDQNDAEEIKQEFTRDQFEQGVDHASDN